MPAPPEIGDGRSEIRPPEIFHDIKAHHFGRADSNIRVTGEIAIYLKGEKVGGQVNRQAPPALRVPVNKIHKIRQPVGDHDLLKKAPQHQLEAVAGPFVVKRVLFKKLRQKVRGPFDRARDQLGKKRHIQGEHAEMFLRRHPPAVHVQGVTQSLKRVKGYAQREQDVQMRDDIIQARRLKHAVQAGGEKIKIFKDPQNPEISGQAEHQKHFAPERSSLRRRHIKAGRVINHRRRHQ